MSNLRKEYLTEWRLWYSMVYKAYNNYNCDLEPSWLDFATWLADVGPRPTPNSRFVRRELEKGFVKDNCSWVEEPRGPRKVWLHKERA